VPHEMKAFDEEYDLVVVGSGAGALTGALTAANRGLRVLLIEKTDLVGGTTSYSGGGMWLPNNDIELDAGVPDSTSLARAYVDGLMGEQPNALKDAYLDIGPTLISELNKNPHLEFWWMPFPDYFDTEGSLPRGRSIYPEELPAATAGAHLDSIRPPLWPPTDPVIWGHALVARFMAALDETHVEIRRETGLDYLVVEAGRVVGIEASTPAGKIRVRARHGVLLACGGFDHDSAMRREYQAPLTGEWSLGAPGNTGDGIRAGMKAGAAVDLMDQAWWTPAVPGPSGGASFLQGLHGGVIVNADGNRYANECLPYDQFGRAMLSGHSTGVSHIPSFLIFDQELLDMYGVPSTPDGLYAGADLAPWFDGEYLWRADSIEALAEQINVPSDNLVATVVRFNELAKVGRDDDFHRGETPYDLFFVAPVESINGALKQVRTGPFYATKVVLGDLGTKGGLVCDEHARVKDEQGVVIPGLYAAGNTMAAWTGEFYLGPGTPIGSSVAFAYLAVLDIAASASIAADGTER
jgi:3-oxosteroid 1-dehydrogenase